MNKRASSTKPPKSLVKTDPYPLRLDGKQADELRELSDKTGLNRGDLMRAALNYWLPRVLSGELSLLESGRK